MIHLKKAALVFLLTAVPLAGLLAVWEGFQYVFLWKAPPFTSVDYARYLDKAVARRDPTACDSLAIALADGTPRASCYFQSAVRIGDTGLCREYERQMSAVSGADGCVQEIAVSRSDASICEDDYCVTQVAVENLNPDLCVEITRRGLVGNFPESRCAFEVAKRVELCEVIEREGRRDDYLTGKCLSLTGQ